MVARFSPMTRCLAAAILFLGSTARAQEIGTHGFVDSDGVRLHYVMAGEQHAASNRPLVVMIHGFPDFWYTWRNQMPALAQHFQVVAYDQRGYNKSGQPAGVDSYKTETLVGDLLAIVDHFQCRKAVIVGHDWGGMVAWTFAMRYPERTDRLVILNLPHPQGLIRELANNPKQRLASAYARAFQEPDAASKTTPEMLAFWVSGAETKQKYVEMFRRSSIEGMLNYYKANFPREAADQPGPEFPPIQCSVLMFHGLKDTALLPGALNGTWNWIARDLTLITIPDAGHFVQHDAAELVTNRLVGWLAPGTPAAYDKSQRQD